MGRIQSELMSTFGKIEAGIDRTMSTLPKSDKMRIDQKKTELSRMRMIVAHRYDKGSQIKPVEPMPVRQPKEVE